VNLRNELFLLRKAVKHKQIEPNSKYRGENLLILLSPFFPAPLIGLFLGFIAEVTATVRY